MCGSMADIQSATAEIRRGKKKKNNDRMKIYKWLPYYVGHAIKMHANLTY